MRAMIDRPFGKLPPDAVIDPRAVAELAACSGKTITRHTQSGKLRGFTVGAVKEWLKEHGKSLTPGRPARRY